MKSSDAPMNELYSFPMGADYMMFANSPLDKSECCFPEDETLTFFLLGRKSCDC